MSEPLAYHAITHALEAPCGGTPLRQFASSVQHALSGHLPYQRYFNAGLARRRHGSGEDTIERLITEQFALDLNPITLASRQTWHPHKFIEAYTAYNEAVNLGVKT